MNVKCSAGVPCPLGAYPCEKGVNFAIFSKDASCVYLELFKKEGDKKPYETIQLDAEKNKTGDIWHIFVKGLKSGSLYLYRAAGLNTCEKGLRFDAEAYLLDPYAKELTAGSVFNAFRAAVPNRSVISSGEKDEFPIISNKADLSLFPKCIVIDDSEFDWSGDVSLNIPLRNSVMYELHVRGYTKSPSSKVKSPGTYAALVEKIPYLKSLGITAVELMPVCEFDENENRRKNPKTGEQLKNFWGYSTVCFFAPKASYAAAQSGGAVTEFKQMIKELHRAGIEVIIDIVFNHTAEGNHLGHTFSFRGLANDVYYILDEKDKRCYKDYTGCGNTMNCNHPVMVQFILDCLHYWVLQMHVDGFRFDLASVFCRAENGDLETFPYLTRAISEDPILKNTKLIAEPWDAAGAYHTGHFPGGRWCSWNDKFRDGMRRFIRGEDYVATEAATRLTGSSDLYFESGPDSSVNFITVHDGFTLMDVVSCTAKHNEANGENNRDGASQNFSYNNGVEGETANAAICRSRIISIKNMLFFLILSQGVPLLLAGDEFGRTQKGNNNAYCQDNDISWVDWTLCKKNGNLVRYVRTLIELRKTHPVFRRSAFFKGGNLQRGILPDIIWYNAEGTNPDWAKLKRFFACRMDGNSMHSTAGLTDNDFYLAANMDEMDCVAILPPLPPDKAWRRVIDTTIFSVEDVCSAGAEEILPSQKRYIVPAHGIVLLLSEDILLNKD